jgi:pyruvate formate lyase activating enzyme
MDPVPSLDAVVFTGGEPILQPEGVIEAAKIVKKYDLLLMLDTNGTMYNEVERILNTGLVDRVALDVKAPLNPDSISVITQKPRMAEIHTEAILKTLKLCKDLGITVEARTTVAPSISDDEEYIRQIARDIKGYTDVYYLQQYDNQGDVLSNKLKDINPPTRESLISLANAAIEEGVANVHIKTRFEGLEKV